MSINNQNNMKINLISELKAIKPGNKRDFICGVELELLKDINNNDQRQPVDIICLIDDSGSMKGQKAQLVRKSLKYLLKILQEGDQISLISFSSRSQILCPLTKVNDENKQQIKQGIKKITGNGNTLVLPGFQDAIKILDGREEKREQTFILLLTDGDFNDGNNQFVMKGINQIFGQSSNQKAPYIYAYGYGDDVNPDILQEIAKKYEGKYCQISKVKQITDWFLLSVSSFLKCSCKEISIKVKEERKDLVYIKSTVGGDIIWRQQNYQTRDFEIYIPLLIPGDKKCFVFECSFDCNSSINIQNNQQIVLKAQLEFQQIENNGQKKSFTLSSNLAIQLLSDVEQQSNQMEIESNNNEIITTQQEPYYENLIVTFYRGLGGKAIKESSDIMQSERDFTKAKEILNSFKNLLKQKCDNFLNNEGIQHLLEDIEEALASCNPNKYVRGRFQKMNAVHERRSRSNSHEEDWNQENVEVLHNYRNKRIVLSDSDDSASRSPSRSISRSRSAKRAYRQNSRSKSRSYDRSNSSYSRSLSSSSSKSSYSKNSGSSESYENDQKKNNYNQRSNRFRSCNSNRSRINNQESTRKSSSRSLSSERQTQMNSYCYSSESLHFTSPSVSPLKKEISIEKNLIQSFSDKKNISNSSSSSQSSFDSSTSLDSLNSSYQFQQSISRSHSRNSHGYSPRRNHNYILRKRTSSQERKRSLSPRRNNNQRQYSNRNNFKSQHRRSYSRSRSHSRSRSQRRENNRNQRRLGQRRY